jgi:hypothetical protein
MNFMAIFKNTSILAALVSLPFLSFPQFRFNTTTTLPKDLDVGTSYSNCASPGTISFSFTVSGLPLALSSNFALASIDITFDANSGNQFNALGMWIISPDGKCMKIYDGGLSTTGYDVAGSGRYPSISLRNGECLNDVAIIANSNWDPMKSVSGNFPVFKPFGTTPDGTTQTMANYFAGTNPNGTWTIYAFQSTGNQPAVSALSLLFANPNVTDRTPDGDLCTSAVEWTGQPMCLQTNGKTSSSNMPGWTGAPCSAGFATTINGVVCDWNNANNNDVWIKFTASSPGGTLCMGISSLDQQQQSIIVTDANVDGDGRPCTQGAKNTTTCNDPNWTVVSCPRNAIYTTTAGTTYSHQYCFTAVANTTYYLVVDGNGGIESPFYLTGFSGPLPAILHLDEQSPKSTNINRKNKVIVDIEGSRLLTNVGNKKILQDIFIYDGLGRLLYKNKRWVTGYSELDINPFMISGFNIIKIYTDDPAASQFTFKLNKVK